jgi:hypothetical protein
MSVGPWERKVRTAPGKVEKDLNEAGRFRDQKADGKPFKGVRRER